MRLEQLRAAKAEPAHVQKISATAEPLGKSSTLVN